MGRRKSVSAVAALDELVVVTVNVGMEAIPETNFVRSSSVVVRNDSTDLPPAQTGTAVNKLTKVEA